MSSIQTWFQNNLPRHHYSKGKCWKQTPTYLEAKRPKGPNTHTLKILLYVNYVHDDEALQDSEVPFKSLSEEEIAFGMTLMLNVCTLFYSSYGKSSHTLNIIFS